MDEHVDQEFTNPDSVRVGKEENDKPIGQTLQSYKSRGEVRKKEMSTSIQ